MLQIFYSEKVSHVKKIKVCWKSNEKYVIFFSYNIRLDKISI